MPDIEHFKRVDFELNDTLLRDNDESVQSFDESIDTLLDSVNKSFKPDELRVFRNGNNFELWLRELEINKLEKIIENLTKNPKGKIEKVNKIQQDFLAQLQKTVYGIGSYGLRGQKASLCGIQQGKKGCRKKEKRNPPRETLLCKRS